MSCKICRDGRVDEINADLAAGLTIPKAAAKYSFAVATMGRHRQKCPKRNSPLVKPAKVAPVATVTASVEIAKLRKEQALAKRRRDMSSYLAIGRQIHSWAKDQAASKTASLASPQEREMTRSEALECAKTLIEVAVREGSPDIIEWFLEVQAWIPVRNAEDASESEQV